MGPMSSVRLYRTNLACGRVRRFPVAAARWASHLLERQGVLSALEAKAEEGNAMTDDEKAQRTPDAVNDDLAWEKIRSRTILAAFQTGRPVFANTGGELRYADGDCEPIADEIGLPKGVIPEAKIRTTRWGRIVCWLKGRL
jgi:hypothetical protein